MGKEFIRRIMVLGEVPSLGPVMLFDNMEDLLKWSEAGTAGDRVLEKSQTLVYNADYSLHVKSRTTDAAEADTCYGFRMLYQRPGKRYAVECLFAPDAGAAAKYVEFKAQVEDGSESHKAWIRYDAVNGKWQYYKPTATWTDVPGGAQNLNDDQFHRVRWSWDEVKKELLTLECDGQSFAVVGLEYDNPGSAQAVSFRLDFGLVAGASPPGEVYFDDVLVMEI